VSWGPRSERVTRVSAVSNRSPLNPQENPTSQQPHASSLTLLSFNIQVGIRTSTYGQYLTRGWKHLLPHEARLRNLYRIAEVVRGYDVVGLQEIDGGSLRSGFINQVEFLSELADFPYWYAQLNRDLGPLAQHGNGLLTRIEPAELGDHKLPGAIPGRGAMFLRLPFADSDMLVVMIHLSLGRQARRRQLSYIAERVAAERHVVIMGDMNSPMRQLLEASPLKSLELHGVDHLAPTYPAWAPAFALDHVLVSSGLQIKNYQVIDCLLSDHLPVAVEVAVR